MPCAPAAFSFGTRSRTTFSSITVSTSNQGSLSLPYNGATFKDVRIGEEGRQLLLRQLKGLSRPQIEALFATTRFSESAGGRKAKDWADLFEEKVQQIENAGPCGN